MGLLHNLAVSFKSRLRRFVYDEASNYSDAQDALFDNTNTPGAQGWSAPTSSVPLVRPRGYVQNTKVYPVPHIEPYIRLDQPTSPYRLHAQADMLLPQIPVRAPSLPEGFTYDLSSPAATNIEKPLVPKTKQPKVVAPSMVLQRETEFNAGNPAVLRTPQAWTPSQRYFDQKQLIQIPAVGQFAHQVYTSLPELKRGWYQSYVPDPGMGENDIGKAPELDRLAPHSERGKHEAVDGYRGNIKRTKAPKRIKSGG